MSSTNLSRRQWLAAGSAALAATAVRLAPAASPPPDVPWLAEVQQPPPALPPDAPQLGPVLQDEQRRPIASLDAWRRRRRAIRRWWLDFLGYWGERQTWSPPLRVVAEDRTAGVVRQLVRYEAEPGWPVDAYLLRPQRIERSCAGAVVLHSTVPHTIRQPAGVEGKPEKAFGLKLAQRGYVALCPRCFLWSRDPSVGYLEQVERFRARHPNAKGMAKMLWDAVVAANILADLPEVDARRLCAVGHSLGAKEVLYLAAFDERIRAAASSEGGVGTRFSNWDAPWYLGPSVREASFDHEHHELLALAAPRPFLLLGGDAADGDRSWPFIQSALPVYRLYGEPPRIGLLNHKKGHNVPPEAERRIYEWLTTYCPP